MKGTTTEAAGHTGEQATARTRRFSLPRWLALPRGDAAARLTLLGLVVSIQNVFELPRAPLRAALGTPLTGIVVVAALSGSLALLLAALRPDLPAWRWPRDRRVQAAVLALVLLATPIGIGQSAKLLAAGFQPPLYPNDGTTLDHYAAQQLLEGHNPYVSVSLIAAVRLYHQDPEHTTPLGAGRFAALYPNHYPTKEQLRAVFATEPSQPPNASPEFESHVSYPALAFLPLVPLVWAGVPSVVPFFALCFFALAALLVLAAPPPLRPWLGLLVLADTPQLNAAVAGDLDIFYILLLFVAWRWWRRPLLSTVFLGLALAAKQLAWFFLPFYAILVWRERGPREAALRLGGAGGIFLAINAPFILNNPGAWLAGVLAPQTDRMFPLGNGLIQLSLASVLPLFPQTIYTAMELLAIVACVYWYWRHGRAYPEYGFVLAVLPLFFAWRSLTTYFYFVALPAAALLIGRLGTGPSSRGVHPAPLRTWAEGWSASVLAVRMREWWARAQASPRAARNTLLAAWGATRLLLFVGMLLGSPNAFSDPWFYHYAGQFAAGQWPYRDFAVEYPPLAVLLILLPALPLLPFAALVPRPDPAFVEPLRSLPHPDPVRYGAYGISFAVEMLLLDLLALWLVRRAGQRLVPGDRYGLRSGLLYVGLIFLSGALLQKFDLVAGVLCLAAVVALVERRDALGWAALAAATLVKGFPVLALPVLAAYVVARASAGTRAFGGSRASTGRPYAGSYAGDVWRRLRMGAAGFVAVALAGTLPVLLAAGAESLARAVLYHADRATEIESLYGNLQLALGWLPGMSPRTRFNYADLSRVVRSPLDAATPALAVATLGLFLLLAYAGVWRALIAGVLSRRGVWRTPAFNGRTVGALGGGAPGGRAPVSRKDERAQTLNRQDVKQSQAQAQAQALAVGVAAVLLAFTLAFRALPAHYLLVVLPLAAVIRLPRTLWHGQRIWLGALLVTAVLGQLLTAAWQALVALQPWAVALLSIRNMAWVIAFGCLAVALWRWPRSPAGGRRRG